MTDQPALFEDVVPELGSPLRPLLTSYSVRQLTPEQRLAAIEWAHQRERARKADPTDRWHGDAVDYRRELERLVAMIGADEA